MRVVVTGPESSGTRWATSIVARLMGAHGAKHKVLHRSMPHNNDWSTEPLFEADLVVIVTRDPQCTWESAVDNRHARSMDNARARWFAAIKKLSEVQLDQVLWVTYEELMYAPDLFGELLAMYVEDPVWRLGQSPSDLRDGNRVRRLERIRGQRSRSPRGGQA